MFCSWLRGLLSSCGQVQSGLCLLWVWQWPPIRGRAFLVIRGGGYLHYFRINYLGNKSGSCKEVGDAEHPGSFDFTLLTCSLWTWEFMGQSLESLEQSLRDCKFLVHVLLLSCPRPVTDTASQTSPSTPVSLDGVLESFQRGPPVSSTN